jgi:nucleoside-diphosphate-sugar epimerase
MRTLVTGATGFIGSHVAAELLRRGHDVTLLTRGMPTTVALDGNARWIRGDLAGRKLPVEAFEGQEAVVHCAGEFGDAGGWTRYRDSLVLGTENAVSLAAGAGVKRFVHISSLAVCDPPSPEGWLDERSPCSLRPPRWNYYARAKIESEIAVWDAARRGKIAAVILRPGITFGIRDRHATPQLLRALAAPIRFRIGDGRNPLACVVVEELASAVGEAVTRSGIDGRCYPLAGNASVTQNDLLEIHAKFIGVAVPRHSLPLPLAIAFAGVLESACQTIGRSDPPITRLGVWILGTGSRVRCDAAAKDLDWKGRESCVDAILRSLAWRERK